MSAGVPVDLLLGLALLWSSWRLLADPDPVRAAVLFIAFGLGAALAWARLGAPDLALAEAAIGSVITGVLVLDAAAALAAREQTTATGRGAGVGRIPAAAAALAAGTLMLIAVVGLPDRAGLSDAVAAVLPETGVEHGVTGVLLSLRAWDTLLEVAVLLGAIAAVSTVAGGLALRRRQPLDPLALWFARLLAPGVVLVGGYLLWVGTSGPGGAFQAGAALAGALLICAVSGAVGSPLRPAAVRILAAVGTLTFIAAAALSALGGGVVLRWPDEVAYEVIIAVELAIAVSVAVILAAVFLLISDPREGGGEES